MKDVIQVSVTRAVSSLCEEGVFSVSEMPTVEVSVPKGDGHGDYTTNIAFLLSSVIKKPPLAVAHLIRDRLSLLEGAETEVVPPGYINFTLSPVHYQDMLAHCMEENISVAPGKKERIMVEYSQPNTLKEFHIGHLRNVFIGSTMVNVLRRAGHVVLAANYIGDTGTHIGKCLWGIVKFHGEENLEERPDKSIFLGKVYSEAVRAMEENPEYEAEAKALQRRLEEGEEEFVALWKKTREWSLEEFKNLYRDLDIDFDLWFFESEEEVAGKKLLPELLEKGIVEKSEGAVVANLEPENLHVLVLVRSDGGVLYGLKDIPLAKRKFEEYGLDRSIYVVDARQTLYFRQLFAVLKRMGFEKPMIHVGYEFVSLKNGESMSSRKGNIISARDIIHAAVEKVRAQFPESPDPVPIALGAIRFSLLRHSAQSKILFDLEESVQLHGATGPYVQYAHARMTSILQKAREKGVAASPKFSNLLRTPKEMALIRLLARYPELVLEVAEDYGVHRLAHFAIELADAFHSFYDECRVVDTEQADLSSARLALVLATKNTLKDLLALIGVSAPERM